MCVAMAALDAMVHVQNGTTTKEIPFVDFHVLPGNHPEIETVLQPGDVITAVEIAKSNLARNSHYLKVRDRASFSFALTSAAVALDGTGTIGGARLALGGVGTKPWRAKDAEAVLVGKPANRDAFRAAAEIAMKSAVPQRFNKFKIELAKRTIVKAYEELAKA
jgi:xanthine dehydrogenase YagS FAD-binding subunit